jgi:NAD(P)-dependent dehydrogenase (short-subunit alcohol dehydrogenase family)
MIRKSAFVTGAAAGIGRAIAERLARAGWLVGAYDVDEQGVRALAASLAGSLGEARCLAGPLDVTSPEQWRARLAEHFAAAGDRLDLLVNNAGIAITGAFAETELARLHRLLDVNLRGVVNGCHAAFPYLRKTPGARVVNLCSASAIHGQPRLAAYAASKAAVRSLTEALDLEWAPDGVRVVDVLPTFVDTAMVRQDLQHMRSVDRLGVRLSADDVAAVVQRLAEAPARALAVHTPVGPQARLLSLAAKLSPDALTHFVTSRITRG